MTASLVCFRTQISGLRCSSTPWSLCPFSAVSVCCRLVLGSYIRLFHAASWSNFQGSLVPTGIWVWVPSSIDRAYFSFGFPSSTSNHQVLLLCFFQQPYSVISIFRFPKVASCTSPFRFRTYLWVWSLLSCNASSSLRANCTTGGRLCSFSRSLRCTFPYRARKQNIFLSAPWSAPHSFVHWIFASRNPWS